MYSGYGKFVRKACQTDEYGESKYHYCAKPVCITTVTPPIPKLCIDFFNNTKTPDGIPKELTEIVVTDKDGDKYCTRSESPKQGSKGWCYVNEDVAKGMGLKRRLKSWGFCSEDCYDYQKNEGPFVLRQVSDVDIIGDKLCNMYLNNSITERIEVKPEVLCIGKIENLKYEQWFKNGNTYSKNQNKIMKNHRMSISEGRKFRIKSGNLKVIWGQ